MGAGVSWKKENLPSNYTAGSAKKESTPKYDTTTSYSRTARPDAKKTNDDKSSSSTSSSSNLRSKYGDTYTTSYRDRNAEPVTSRSTSDLPSTPSRTSSLKPVEKKDTSHPPVTYRPIVRTSTAPSRSRDPSPTGSTTTDKSESTSSSFSYNRLYPRPYNNAASSTRSISRERSDSVCSNSSTTIPKYSGRSSIHKDEPKYTSLGGRTSRTSSIEDLSLAKYKPEASSTKETLLSSRFKLKDGAVPTIQYPKYKAAGSSSTSSSSNDKLRYKSKEDLASKYKSKEDLTSKYKSKEDLVGSSSRYKTASRTSSREDLSTGKTGPQKYITSRFLPKNTIEKSATSTYRPASIRTNDVSRKNRELLNVLSTHDDRSSSRASSRTPDELLVVKTPSQTTTNIQDTSDLVEMENILVVTRSTSPNLPTCPTANSSTSYVRSRRSDVARLVEKQISRTKLRPVMIDAEMQSDRLDDSTKYSRYTSGSTRITSPPWSAYLDLKYSSPKQQIAATKSSGNEESSSVGESGGKEKLQREKSNITKPSLSRTSSGKSVSSTDSVKQAKVKSKDEKSSKKLLPPQIPKAESSTTVSKVPLHGYSAPNKDFRKSVLNMSGSDIKQNSKRSTSVSSAESDSSICAGNSEATEISENLSSCVSYHNKSSTSSQSKLPQRVSTISNIPGESELLLKGRKSHSTSPSSDSSSSSSSSNEEDTKLVKTKPKSSSGSKLKLLQSMGSRSSIIVANDEQKASPKPPLSPRNKADQSRAETEAKSFLMRALAPVTNFFKTKQDSTDKDSSEETSKEDTRPRKLLCRIESGERALWLEEKNKSSSCSSSDRPKMKLLRHAESGDLAWWLDSKAEVPKDVQVHPVTSLLEDGSTEEGQLIYQVRRTDSMEKEWWLDSTTESSGLELVGKKVDGEHEPEFLQKYQIRHIDSGERAWWLSSSDNLLDTAARADKESARFEKCSRRSVGKDNSTTVVSSNSDKSKECNISSEDKDTGLVACVAKIHYSEEHQARTNFVEDSQDRINLSEDSQTRTQPKTHPQSRHPNSETHEHALVDSEAEDKDWWQSLGIKEVQSDDDEVQQYQGTIPLGDRASPEGLETPRVDLETSGGRLSPYENVPVEGRQRGRRKGRESDVSLFISRHTNIDDVLGGSGGQLLSPLMETIFSFRKVEESDLVSGVSAGNSGKVPAEEGRGIVQATKMDTLRRHNKIAPSAIQLDDASLQLYKDGDYGSYLDLEASISEQQEEFEGFQSNKKNSIVLRTQLSVRVHTIIEKLSTSEGKELRRALFSLKQIFQEDKDLVHEFVQNDGLACLIKVGSEADQNYQNYILRALGQVMLYVDGMNGVMENNQTIQWLYALISSKFRLVVKTALKLLLVFVEYVDSNCMLLIKAIHTVDVNQGLPPWYNIMKLLNDFDSADTELLIYATTLINKSLNGITDQDTYYDQADSLEEQHIATIIQRYMSRPGTDLDLLQQFQVYEAVLQYEDGDDKTAVPGRHLDESVRRTLRHRKSGTGNLDVSVERRKSRRHSTGSAINGVVQKCSNGDRRSTTVLPTDVDRDEDDDDESSSSQSSGLNGATLNLNGSYKDCNKANDAGVTPALRRRRERAERQRSFMKEQETATILRCNTNENDNNGLYTNGVQQRLNSANNILSRNNNNAARKDLTPLLNAVNKLDPDENGLGKHILIVYNDKDRNVVEEESILLTNNDEQHTAANNKSSPQSFAIKRENTVKDLTQKLSQNNNNATAGVNNNNNNNSNNTLGAVEGQQEGGKVSARIGDMTGLISKAMEGLAKSKSQANVAKNSALVTAEVGNGGGGVRSGSLTEVSKKTETELRWEELVVNISRPLNLCDMDFTDLASDDEADILTPAPTSNGIPPPPPPLAPPPPPPNSNHPTPPPPPIRAPPPLTAPPPPLFGVNLHSNRVKLLANSPPPPLAVSSEKKKQKKTVKLFWKEVRDDPMGGGTLGRVKSNTGYIWDELQPVPIDTQKLEHLFESRAKDIISKKQQESNKNKEIIVLDPKRSNAINIGMTKLPPPRTIKTAILKMDATIMNREGIEKLLTMLPTDEERNRIQEAQVSNPDLPLGSAEQFLLTLASISELPARLKLWAFKLDFESTERECAEPLMDLKQGFETLRVNKTFRGILSTLLSIGNFLNGNAVRGFQIEYLAKVPEVKDTVHKHSLLHHLCHIVMEKFPDATDLYSEIGAVTRASKVDFDELGLNIQRLESDCKTSWDHLKLIAKHDGSTMKAKMSDFLSDCAERIILLGIIYRRVMNRFNKFLLWLGMPTHQISDTKSNEFCRIVSEFALEYRTTRERVLQQLEKKANHRERNKTRGKMITETGKFSTSTKEDRADAELRQLLGSDMSDVESLQGTWRRTRRSTDNLNSSSTLSRTAGFNNSPSGQQQQSLVGYLNSNSGAGRHVLLGGDCGDDEILESLVKTATKTAASRTAPRERKRTRHADRKSLRRTLKNGLSDEEKKHISTYIKGY